MSAPTDQAGGLLCLGGADELRAGYRAGQGDLRRRLDHFIWVARHCRAYPEYQIQQLQVVPEGLVRPLVRPDESAYPFLAFVLTGDPAFAELARQRLFDLAASVAERETGDWTQLHTWCDAFPFARWLVLADWVWDSPVFSDDDRHALEERFLYYLWAHPYQRLKARTIETTPGNNQNAAMAFACAVGGYLFGLKRGDHPRARQILPLGFSHLLKFVTAFPAGGYSFEGSTYMGGVNALILPLGLELVQATVEADLLDCRESETTASPREVLEAIMHLTSPGGLLHPWDSYGYSRASFTATAAYLAYRIGDDRPLRFLQDIGAVEEPDHVGWGFDRTLWTLLWMLKADAGTGPRPAGPWSFSYCQPSVAAATAGPEKRLFVMQMWDRSHWPPSRAHFNPNSLIVEYDGAPLMLDGQCVESAKAEMFTQKQYRSYRSDVQKEFTFGPGTVGAHNTIFFDDEEHYAAPLATEGVVRSACFAADAAWFESDVTDCYRPRYDVTSVQRATLVLGDELVVVRDRIRSDQPHRVTWRVHLREGEADRRATRFSLRTPERIQLEVCVPENYTLEHRHFRGDGNSQLGGSCHEVSYSAAGADLTLFTMLTITPGLEIWRTLADGWELAIAPDAAAVEQLLRAWPGGTPVSFREASWFYTSGHHEPGIGVYRYQFEVDQCPPARLWLRLPRMTRSTRLRVNGHEHAVRLAPEELPLLPHLVEVSGLLRRGPNVIEVIVPSTLETALHGEISLLVPTAARSSSKLVQLDEHHYELHHHGRRDRLTWGDTECFLERDGGETLRLTAGDASPAAEHGGDRRGARLAEVLDRFQQRMSDGPAAATSDCQELVAAIGGDDWRVALAALEAAEGTTDPAVIEAAWQRLQDEARYHETLPARQSDDVNWYRLKAAAARVLGAARHEAATDLLGEMLLGTDFYPVRVACAWALGQIGSAHALDHLQRVPGEDEVNTVREALRAGM